MSDQLHRLIAQWRERANERGTHGGFPRHSERTIATLRQCADDLERFLLAERPQPQEAQGRAEFGEGYAMGYAARHDGQSSDVVYAWKRYLVLAKLKSEPLGSPTP